MSAETEIDVRAARLAGLAGTAVGLAVLWAASGLDESIVFPPLALAQALIRATPGGIATFFIETLGHWARRLMAVAAVVVAALVGGEILARVRADFRTRTVIAASVLVVSGVISVFIDPMSEAQWLPSVIALLVAGAAFVWVSRSVYENLTAEATVDGERREFLKIGLTGAAGLTIAGGALGWIARKFGGPDRNVQLTSAAATESIPTDSSFPKVKGLTPEVTPAARHYVVDINLIPPTVEATGWRLPVHGEVDNPLELSFGSLQRDFEIVEEYAVLTCISNEVGGNLIGHSAWGGVRLMDVLKKAGIKVGTGDIVFRAADGYSDSIPIAAAMDPAVLLAVSQNGEPLTQDHGFPCRVRIPSIYGMKNVKWLQDIEVVGNDYRGYWEQRGWSDEAIVKTESRIDVPDHGSSVPSGTQTWIAGVAWAGDRGIERVEVSTDGGRTWSEAQLKTDIGNDSWRLWAYAWTPNQSGSTTIMCRATDGNGDVQTDKSAPPHPSGSSGYHAIEVDVS